jgi:hypothetical protein
MTDLMSMTAARLRQRAARCRALADSAASGGIAGELSAIAADYEEDAARLESRRATRRDAERLGLN